MLDWLLHARHNAPTAVTATPSTADFGVNRKIDIDQNAAELEVKRIADIQASVKASALFAARALLPERARSRSSSVDRVRERHPLVTPTPGTVRAHISADMRELTRGIGATCEQQAYLIGSDPKVWDDTIAFAEELFAILADEPTTINADTDWYWYSRLVNHSVCFRNIPNDLYEEVCVERIFTCNGIAPFGHCGIIAAAVKYTEVGPNKYTFNGMVYVTFADRDVACLFQSYWRESSM